MNFTRTDELARYRLGLKYLLKRAGIAYDKDAPTEELEKQVAQLQP